MLDDTSEQTQEKHAKQLNRQPWEPSGVSVSHQPKKDHTKKTQTIDKGGITNLDVEDMLHNKGIMDK